MRPLASSTHTSIIDTLWGQVNTHRALFEVRLAKVSLYILPHVSQLGKVNSSLM